MIGNGEAAGRYCPARRTMVSKQLLTSTPEKGVDEGLWRAVKETMQDGLLVVDAGGRILAVNPAFERMTGYTDGELIGASCSTLNCTGCRVIGLGLAEDWCALFRKGRIRRRKCLIKTKNGRSIHVLKQATVLRNEEGRPTGAVEIITDMSEATRREEELHSLRTSLYRTGDYFGLIGSSRPIRRLIDLIDNVAQSDAPVLILGESGVGKELVARAVHDAGERAREAFIKVNCSSLNENLLESELFGHVKGAFTGADKTRVGRFEAAHGGSILLDEIGDISPATQVKLLRVLEAGEIERVGDHTPIKIDARLITATNRNLEELITAGRFREDLFYRINVVPIVVPPLRDRLDDVPIIAQAFCDKIAARTGKPIQGLGPAALARLTAYDWPGNVRELVNAIEYAFVICTGDRIEPEHLPPKISDHRPAEPVGPPVAAASAGADHLKRELIETLARTKGNQSEAARRLGVSRVTIWKRMKKFGLKSGLIID